MKRTTPQIAIVGAGIAGLTAALTLQDAGVACTLYEASDRVGGRMHSDATWGGGLVSEWCGEFIDATHTTILKLIERFGLATHDLGRGISDQAPSVLYLAQRYVTENELAQDFREVAPLLQQQWQAAGYPTTYDHFNAEGQRLDQMSVYAWIEQYIPGGHATPLGRFMNSTCSGLYGLETRDQSALNLVYQFGARAMSPGMGMVQPLRGVRNIVGGNAELPLTVARALPPGCIQMGHSLMAIAHEGDGAVRLSFATAAGKRDVVCDEAILALPFSTLRQVDYQQAGFAARKQQAIQELGYGTISKLFLEFDQPYWQTDGPWPHPNTGFIITDLGIQTLWDTSSGQPNEPHILVDYTSGARGAAYAPTHPYVTTAEDATIARYAQECVQQLEPVFPGISAHYKGRAALSYPTGDPHLLGSYSCWRVGQYTRFGGYEGTQQGPIHFAGEHCSVLFQGYMEGAAQEGIRAAREVIQAMA